MVTIRPDSTLEQKRDAGGDQISTHSHQKHHAPLLSASSMASEMVSGGRRISRALFAAFLLTLLLHISNLSAAARSEEAYVTLLYGDQFLLGARVLGKSIQGTGSTRDMVVLVSDGVSRYAQSILEADGWIVEQISLLANPNQIRPKRFWGVYTKLKIFNMTAYKKVVYLDADTVVVKNIDDLFKCGKFCANLKHSERMNSGVMVVEPSEETFNDMVKQINSLPSYTGGDQGFLNSYYAGFANAHIFEPEAIVNPIPKMQRLTTLYNADVGLYMLANKWMVDEKELRIIHYTLGPLKPWNWWTAWLVKPVDVWQDVRIKLEESLPGTGGGSNPSEQLLIKFLFILPLCIFAYVYYKSFTQVNSNLSGVRICIYDYAKRAYYKFRSGAGLPAYSNVSVSAASIANSNQQFQSSASPKLPCFLGAASVLACFLAAIVSLAIAFSIIPQQVLPWTGLLLMYEWTFTIFFLVFAGYVRLIFLWGKSTANRASFVRSESSDYDSEKGRERHASSCDAVAWLYGLGIALLAVFAPSLPCIFGITALFPKLGLMVGGGLVLSSFLTYASEHLAIRAFIRGYEDHEQPRSRSMSTMC